MLRSMFCNQTIVRSGTPFQLNGNEGIFLFVSAGLKKNRISYSFHFLKHPVVVSKGYIFRLRLEKFENVALLLR